MKPTENTFFFPFSGLRIQAPPPNEKVEKLESLRSFDLFDFFVNRLSGGKCGRRHGLNVLGRAILKARGSFQEAPSTGNARPAFWLVIGFR